MHLFNLLILFNLFWFGNSAPIKSLMDEEQEAISIALESTSELLPDPEIIAKIRSDLRLIRNLNPTLAGKVHQGKWKPGFLLLKQNAKNQNNLLSPKQVQELEQSEFKPVKFLPRGGRHANVILHFQKSFHPQHLARLIKLRFGLDSEPIIPKNGGNTNSDNVHITYRHDLSTYFWNSVNGRNCLDGCFAQYSVSIFADKKFQNGLTDIEFGNDIGKK